MEIKVIDAKSGTPMIDGTICYINEVKTVDDEDGIKHFLNEGTKILIKQNGEFISAEQYFKEDETDENVDKDYSDLFDAHYTKRIDNIKNYTEDKKEVENILKYAQENDQPDSVLEDIEEYSEEL